MPCTTALESGQHVEPSRLKITFSSRLELPPGTGNLLATVKQLCQNFCEICAGWGVVQPNMWMHLLTHRNTRAYTITLCRSKVISLTGTTCLGLLPLVSVANLCLCTLRGNSTVSSTIILCHSQPQITPLTKMIKLSSAFLISVYLLHSTGPSRLLYL